MLKQTRHRFGIPEYDLYRVLLKSCLFIVVGITNKADIDNADLGIANTAFATSRPFFVALIGDLGAGPLQTVVKPAN